ncbi:MAG TPA: dihydrofolate reductase [Candidatus Edwardsbacteria bacterium]|nr:dihydrofolate reductase [Candidatus Edwardsbacteria bacterium]
MPQKSIIVAMTRGRVIGIGGRLPWHISEDLRLFKMLTLGHTVVMGRTTFDSIGKPLPKRSNIVLSSRELAVPGVIHCRDFAEALREADKIGHDVFFIGGASVYAQALSVADAMHVSWVKQDYQGDAYFPEFDPAQWTAAEETDYPDFTYTRYQKNH